MISRAIITLQQPDPLDNPQDVMFNTLWADHHPSNKLQDYIFEYLKEQYQEELSKIMVFEGRLIYLKWFPNLQSGLITVMDVISGDFFKIGLYTYNWIQYLIRYQFLSSVSRNDLRNIIQENLSVKTLDNISKVLPVDKRRDWFDIAIQGGILVLDLTDNQISDNFTNLFMSFPWILYFIIEGNVDDHTMQLSLSLSSDYDLNHDEIFEHITGEIDEQFWILLYRSIQSLQNIPIENRATTCFRYLQAIHDFTSDNDEYEQKMANIFDYKDLLSSFDIQFLINYVQNLLMDVSNQEVDSAGCELLLDFSALLLELEFTDLAKLAEATTLEKSLSLDYENKKKIVLELTQRTAIWGEQHLVSFIQTLTGLLSNEEGGKEILSEAINEVTDQLNKSWDGMLCIVEAKIIANKVEDAVELRFLASGLISDKFSRAEDIFSSIIWSLQYEITAQRLYELSEKYLDYSFDTLTADSLIGQCDLLTQRSLLNKRYEFLRYFFQYIRTRLGYLDSNSYQNLINTLDQLLTDKRLYPLVYIEYLLIRMFVLQRSSPQNRDDEAFKLVSHIFNHINPTLSTTAMTLQYISSQIIRFGAAINNWAIIEEVQRRYLLLSDDRDKVKKTLKTIFFQTALERSRLPGKELHVGDIGLNLFEEGLQLSDIAEDYSVITKIIPRIKKMAMKSRSYEKFIDLVLSEVRLKKLIETEWVDELSHDLNKIIGKVPLDQINTLFGKLYSFYLTEKEEQDLIVVELQLVESEPDLLTADEIYSKRLRLGQTAPEIPDNIDFIVENYQQGISELMSKGDTSNLTNLLLDAITFSQKYNLPTLTEFKNLLVDNFENITQGFDSESSEMYLYMLTIWRKVIDHFKETDLSIIISFALKLYRLNLTILDESDNNQYLRRAQLIMKELTLIVKNSPLSPADDEIITIYEELDRLFVYLEQRHKDFGIVSAIRQAALAYSNLNQSMALFPHIDVGINKIKREIINDDSASSSIFLLLLLLCEVGVQIKVSEHPNLLNELGDRIKRVINFAQSLDLSPELSKQIKGLRDTAYRSPDTFIHEFPVSLGNYIDLTPTL